MPLALVVYVWFLEFSEGTSDKQRYFVSGGIIEVINNVVSVLVDYAIAGDKVVKEDITTLFLKLIIDYLLEMLQIKMIWD